MNEKHESYLVQRWELETRSEADERTRVYLTPKRIVWETNDKDASVENSAVLLEQKSRQISRDPTELLHCHMTVVEKEQDRCR